MKNPKSLAEWQTENLRKHKEEEIKLFEEYTNYQKLIRFLKKTTGLSFDKCEKLASDRIERNKNKLK